MKQTSLSKRVSAIVAAAATILTVGVGVQAANADDTAGLKPVAINAENFPDENLRKAVAANDYNHDNVLDISGPESHVGISVYDVQITSTKGLELLPTLTFLDLVNTGLTSLDVSRNPELDRLNVSNYLSSSGPRNAFTSIDLSKNPKLTSFIARGNKFTSVDVSKNPELFQLEVPDNALTGVDVSKNAKLEYLDVSGNKLTALDVTKNAKLKELDAYDNKLAALDVTKNTKLTDLYVADNKIAALDVTKNPELLYLSVSRNALTSLDVTKNPELTSLRVDSNALTSLDVTKNPELLYLSVDSNALTGIDLSKNTKLERFSAYRNKLAALDVSKNTKLTYLDANDNKLTALDVTKNAKLKELDASDNKLAALDVTNATALTDLYVYRNALTSLDAAGSPKLENLNLDINPLVALNLPKSLQNSTNKVYTNGNLTLKLPYTGSSVDLAKVASIFDGAKVQGLSGAKLNGATLTGLVDGSVVYYQYDLGGDKKLPVQITFSSATKTPTAGDYVPTKWIYFTENPTLSLDKDGKPVAGNIKVELYTDGEGAKALTAADYEVKITSDKYGYTLTVVYKADKSLTATRYFEKKDVKPGDNGGNNGGDNGNNNGQQPGDNGDNGGDNGQQPGDNGNNGNNGGNNGNNGGQQPGNNGGNNGNNGGNNGQQPEQPGNNGNNGSTNGNPVLPFDGLTGENRGRVTVTNATATVGSAYRVYLPADSACATAVAAGNECRVSAYLYSDPVRLAASDGADTAAVVKNGDQYYAEFRIPTDVVLGDHRIAVYGADNALIGWTPVTVASAQAEPSDNNGKDTAKTDDGKDTAKTDDGKNTTAKVEAPKAKKTLASTGASVTVFAVIALALIALGAGLVAARKRSARR